MSTYGLRVWRLGGVGIYSVGAPAKQYKWHQGWNEAVCRICDRPGGSGCQCGFYAALDPEQLRGVYAGGGSWNEHPLLGAVEVAGRYTLHENGVVRAARARIVALVDDDTPTVRSTVRYCMAQVRRDWPDVAFYSSWRALLAEWPPTPADEVGAAEPRLLR